MTHDQAQLAIAEIISLSGLGPAQGKTLSELLFELKMAVGIQAHHIETICIAIAQMHDLLGVPGSARTASAAWDELRLAIQTRMHDLESTRRENKYLRIMLEEQSSE